MKPQRRLPTILYGLWAISGASLVLAVASLVQAWRRPVSGIAGIAPVSDTVDVLTGRILHAPSGQHAGIDLQPDDRILAVDGMLWEQVQRLNLHELPQHPLHTTLQALVQRGEEQISIGLPLIPPDAWEQLVLARYGLAALVLWFTPTMLLFTLTRAYMHQKSHNLRLFLQQSGIPLWFLAWQSVAIAQSLGSLKYPVAVLGADILTPLIAAAIAITSLPYPLAPISERIQRLTPILLGYATISALATCLHALQSPFPTDDWKYAVQLLRPVDPTWRYVRLPIIVVGVMLAVAGIFLTALAHHLPGWVRRLSVRSPHPVQRWLHWLAEALEDHYQRCPPSIQVIASFQAAIILIYLLLDLIPQIMGGVGGGYSVLLAAIPLSYLLLFADRMTQRRGQQLLWGTLVGVVGIQVPNLSVRLVTGAYGMGANQADILTIFLIAGSTLGGGMMLAGWQVFRRWQGSHDALQQAIDALFAAEKQEDLWNVLVTRVGRHMGVEDWLWVTRATTATSELQWEPLEWTSSDTLLWLRDLDLHAALNQLIALRPESVTIGRTTLPSTLVLLPLGGDSEHEEVLIAINPHATGKSSIDDPHVYSRVLQALTVLRKREHERLMSKRQHDLIEKYREVTHLQRQNTFKANTRISGLIHDEALAALGRILTHLDEAMQLNDAPTSLGSIREQGSNLARSLRQISNNLRPPGVGQYLKPTIEQAVMDWEYEYPKIRFIYDFEADESNLDEYTRDSIYMIIKQLFVNALKYANARTITIRVWQAGDQLLVQVTDDGQGFIYDPTHIRADALGLYLREDMARDLNGTLKIETSPGAGCRATLQIPYPSAPSHT
ncbi:sensor histidine kinase [Candidatus Oscillochloris fontis]|uniref:sensor histidine kinase n=1 Tax=Candidatus Oscillochloris fontis TaxID=2496868 RepID=UPI00101B8D21|nr:ATP-binding protein [Candidatus Oscillochloris fontis]